MTDSYIPAAEREEMRKHDPPFDVRILLDHASAADERVELAEDKAGEQFMIAHEKMQEINTLKEEIAEAKAEVERKSEGKTWMRNIQLKKQLADAEDEINTLGLCLAECTTDEADNAALRKELADAKGYAGRLRGFLSDSTHEDLTHADKVICELEEIIFNRHQSPTFKLLRKEVERLKEDCENYFADEQKLRTENERLEYERNVWKKKGSVEENKSLRNLLTEAGEKGDALRKLPRCDYTPECSDDDDKCEVCEATEAWDEVVAKIEEVV